MRSAYGLWAITPHTHDLREARDRQKLAAGGPQVVASAAQMQTPPVQLIDTHQSGKAGTPDKGDHVAPESAAYWSHAARALCAQHDAVGIRTVEP